MAQICERYQVLTSMGESGQQMENKTLQKDGGLGSNFSTCESLWKHVSDIFVVVIVNKNRSVTTCSNLLGCHL